LEDNSYHLIVPVEINGIQGDMIIDTGASVTVVDRQVFPEDLPEEADVQMTSGSVTGQIHDVNLKSGNVRSKRCRWLLSI